MTNRTHELAALTAINICIALVHVPKISLATTIAAFSMCLIGGIITDIDRPTSKIWHKIPAGNFLGRLLQPFLGAHRHLSHSIIGIILIAIGVKYLLLAISPIVLIEMNVVWWAFLIGLISHILMDLLTIEGIPLLFPIGFHFGLPPIKFLRIKSGGFREKFLIFPGLFIVNISLIYAHYPKYLQLVHSLVK